MFKLKIIKSPQYYFILVKMSNIIYLAFHVSLQNMENDT